MFPVYMDLPSKMVKNTGKNGMENGPWPIVDDKRGDFMLVVENG